MARSTTIPVPHKRDDCPQVAAFLAKDSELKGEAQRIERDLADIEAGITSARSKSSLDDAARELLEDGVAALSGVGELHQQREAVQAKGRIVLRAIEMNRHELDDARAAASRRITESRQPEYVGIVRDVAAKVVALQAAVAKEVAFHDRLEQDGGSMTNGELRSMYFDSYPLGSWLAEAKTHYGI